MRKIFLFIMLIFIGTSLVGFSEVTSKKKVLMEKFKKEIKKLEEKEDTDTKPIENLIALTKEYIKENPSEAYAYEYLGILLMSQGGKYDEAEKNFLKSIELGNNDTGVASLIKFYETKYNGKYSLLERVFGHNAWEKSKDLLIEKMKSEEFKDDKEYQKIIKIIEKMNDIFKYDTGYEYLKFIRRQKTSALFLENIEAAESLTSFYEEIEDLPKAKKWARTAKELIEKSKNKKDYSETLDYVNKILEQR